MTPNVSVLVVSCDKYADLWPIFFNGYFKYWHDFNIPIYLGSNFKKYPDNRVITLTIGEDKDYTSNLLKMLSEIKTEYVIILVEDIFLSEKIDFEGFNNFIDQFMSSQGIYLKLIYSYPLSYGSDSTSPIGNIDMSSRYRIGIAAAIWNKTWLENNLPPGMSAWDLEKKQSKFAEIPEMLAFAINKNYKGQMPFKSVHGVIKGKWYRESVPYIKKEGFSHALKGRPIQSLVDYMYVKLYRFVMSVFIKINFVWKQRR